MASKFHALVDPLLGADRAGRIREAIETLDLQPNMAAVALWTAAA